MVLVIGRVWPSSLCAHTACKFTVQKWAMEGVSYFVLCYGASWKGGK